MKKKFGLIKLFLIMFIGNAFCRYFQGVIKNNFNLLKRCICIIIIKLNSINKTIIVYNKQKDKVAYIINFIIVIKLLNIKGLILMYFKFLD